MESFVEIEGNSKGGDGSFQVHFSFVAVARIDGFVFFHMGEFAAGHLQNCVRYSHLQGRVLMSKNRSYY